MKIRTKIGTGKTVHAAEYDPQTGSIDLFCDRLTYPAYYAAISDDTPPTAENVTCKKCIKIINEKGNL